MVDLALGARRRPSLPWVLVREFFAIAGLFATMTAWFIVAAAITG